MAWVSLLLDPRAALAGGPPVEDVVAVARALHLEENVEWLHLVHYNRGFLGGGASEVTPGGFFLSPLGATNHEAELVATLSAMLLPVVPGHEDEHALCRFPARREWLDAQLHFLDRRHPPACPALEHELEDLDIEHVSLVYASTFVGNPASAFGHTFLHLETRVPPGTSAAAPARDPVDFGVEYRALTTTQNPALYAFRGLAGLFPARVERRPYDVQARTYTAEQGRDLWEYELALTPAEVRFLALHLWEIAQARIDYYYLTRNCSFEVIALLDTAAPRLRLLSDLKALVLPIDTVKAVFEIPGLVRGVAYRPSLETRLRTRLAGLSTSEEVVVRHLLQEPGTAWPEKLSPDRRAVVLDAAIFEVVAHSSTELETNGPSKARTTWIALVARREGPPAPEPVIHPDWDVRPDFSHGSMRAFVGTGATTQYGDSYGTLGFRLALHDLTDPPDGSPELSQVIMLDTRFREYWARRSLTLDRLTFADLTSLNPVAPADPLVSWRIRAFGERLHDGACLDCFAHGLDGSIGATVATHDERVAFFVMADAYTAFLPHLTGMGHSFVRLGVGPFGGLRVRLGETVGLLTGTVSYLPGSPLTATYDARLSVKTSLRKLMAVGVEAAAQPKSAEAELMSFVYF